MSGPIGISVLRKLFPEARFLQSRTFYKSLVLVLTFISYCTYHLSRRPLSVVKSVLNQNCSALVPPPGIIVTNATKDSWCDWVPFDGANANTTLGLMDSCYLFSYAFFMFFSGFLAERCNLRYFLALGMIFSGIFTYLFGIAYYENIHNIWYFAIVQILGGAMQTTGWPATVAAVAHWFPPQSSRGVVFGFWNAHTNLGNILGAAIAGAFVEYNWGLSFMVPGLIIAAAGFLIFLFLAPYPEEVGFMEEADESRFARRTSLNDDLESTGSGFISQNSLSNKRRKMSRVVNDALDKTVEEESSPLIETETTVLQVTSSMDREAVSFWGALRVPGVIEYSLSLFFCKLVSYTFLYWLPLYINLSTTMGAQYSAYLSVPFDVGGILGAVLAGLYADRTGASGLTCIVMIIGAFPSLYAYQIYGNVSLWSNIILQFIAGAFVNGPYALITTAVAADLGNSVTSGKAMATITAIIDGTGSIGAAIGPLVAGWISQWGWHNVFYMVFISDFLSLLFLIRIGKNELIKIRARRRNTP
ncbi:putative glycerol-3-phosphate transporter 5 [Halotydeus destructor]|nr:putative glycerol-3-phosphate transporter 5 [Halotydeus destructor]